MKNYRYIIIEIKEYNSKHHVTIWNEFHKSKRREAKKMCRQLKRWCGDNHQWVFVKVRENE